MSDTTLPSALANRLRSLLQDATANSQHVPGIVFQVINRDGETTYSNASGLIALGGEEPMSNDTIFWIASCTKLITAIALMQLVEREKVDLDSANLLEKFVPELKNVEILDDGKLRKKVNSISLRMLMTHTAGLSYSFYNEDIWQNHFHRDSSKDEFQGYMEGIQQPLIYEPGTSHDYSVGIDWVGVFIERYTGITLEEYMQTNIFRPLGMTNTSFSPSDEMRSKLAGFHQRGEKLEARPHFYGPARENRVGHFLSAGAGLLSTAADYTRVLSMLLNDGVSPHTQQRILARETIELMFQNQIPEYMQRHVGIAHKVSRPDLVVPPQSETVPVTGYFGWGLNFLLQDDPEAPNEAHCEKFGFPRASATGLSNCFWTLDRKKGTAAVCLSQILPFGDPYVFPLWLKLGSAIFENEK